LESSVEAEGADSREQKSAVWTVDRDGGGKCDWLTMLTVVRLLADVHGEEPV
jgi:hypothetical protein